MQFSRIFISALACWIMAIGNAHATQDLQFEASLPTRLLAPARIIRAEHDHFGGFFIQTAATTDRDQFGRLVQNSELIRIMSNGEIDTYFKASVSGTGDLWEIGPDRSLYFLEGGTANSVSFDRATRFIIGPHRTTPTIDTTWTGSKKYSRLFVYPNLLIAITPDEKIDRLSNTGFIQNSCQLQGVPRSFANWSEDAVFELSLGEPFLISTFNCNRTTLEMPPGIRRIYNERPPAEVGPDGQIWLGIGEFAVNSAKSSSELFIASRVEFIDGSPGTATVLKYNIGSASPALDWVPPRLRSPSKLFLIGSNLVLATPNSTNTSTIVRKFLMSSGNEGQSFDVPLSGNLRLAALPGQRLAIIGNFIDSSNTNSTSFTMRSLNGAVLPPAIRVFQPAQLEGGRLTSNNELYITGPFSNVDSDHSPGIAKLDASRHSIQVSSDIPFDGKPSFGFSAIDPPSGDIYFETMGSARRVLGDDPQRRTQMIPTQNQTINGPIIPLGNRKFALVTPNTTTIFNEGITPIQLTGEPRQLVYRQQNCQLGDFFYLFAATPSFETRPFEHRISDLSTSRTLDLNRYQPASISSFNRDSSNFDRMKCRNGQMILPQGISGEISRAPARLLIPTQPSTKLSVDQSFGYQIPNIFSSRVIDYDFDNFREVIALSGDEVFNRTIDFQIARNGVGTGSSLLPPGVTIRGVHRHLLLNNEEILAFGFYRIRDGAREATSNLLRFSTRPTLRLLSRDLAGRAAGGASAIAAGSGLLVFESAGKGLWNRPEAGTRRDVYTLDALGNVTELVSQFEDQRLNGQASASDGGEVVVFSSAAGSATSIQSGFAKNIPGAQIVSRNLRTGSTQRVSVATNGTVANGSSQTPRVSGNGSIVVFESTATNLVATPDPTGITHVYRKNLSNEQVTRLSVTAAGQLLNGPSLRPATNLTGSHVVFETTASNLPGAPGNNRSIIVLSSNNTTTLVSRGLNNQPANGASSQASVDDSGRWVLFQSDASNLVAGDSNGATDVFLADLQANPPLITRVSKPSTGEANGPSRRPAFSADARYIVFETAASNLFPDDSNAKLDIVAFDRNTGGFALASRGQSGVQGNGDSSAPSISRDGRDISFESTASNLIAQDSDTRLDAYAVSNPLFTTRPVNHTGTYWNPQESGHGLFVVQAGNTLVPAWYTYDTDGKPLWFLVSGATLQPDGSYSGGVFRYTGAPFNQTPANAVQSTNQVGTARLRFGAGGTVEFHYTINNQTQTRNLVKFDIAPSSPLTCAPTASPRSTATNYTDLWWNPNQQGWGLNLQHQGSSIFLAWYTFGPDQRPMWVSGLAQRQANGSFTGTLNRPVTGTPWPQINGTPATAQPIPTVGNFTLNFSNGETATFNWTLDGVTQTRSIRRFEFGSPATVCANG